MYQPVSRRSRGLTRREVVKGLGAASLFGGAAAAAAAYGASAGGDVRAARIGIIGVGARGTSLLETLLGLDHVAIPALADIDRERLDAAATLVERTGAPRPALYGEGPEHFRSLITRDDLDAVIIATPWEWHTPMAVAAMKAGKYVGVEVPAALTVDECWELVRTSERTGVWCMMLENVCYFREVMQVLGMVRAGEFGELLNCAGGYNHDARASTFDSRGNFDASHWYTWHALKRDGNLYPTHPIGPIAQCLNIDRGDRFDYLVSVSSKALGLNKWVADRHGPDHPNAKRKFALGDVNTTIIKSISGATVTLTYDVQAPRPYDLAIRVQGTRGIYEMARAAVHLEGRSPPDQWQPLADYREKYEHPLWRTLGAKAVEFGHSGSDYIMLHRFRESVIRRTAPEQDVYDAATWSSIFPLSEQSVARRGAQVQFPDFTQGRWQTRRPVPIIHA
jgi:predicted dehydrogenase